MFEQNMDSIDERLLKGYNNLAETIEEDYSEMPIPLELKEIVEIGDEDEIVPKVRYDKDAFIKGVKDFSYLSGAFTALRNAGMSSTEALSIIQMDIEKKLAKKQIASQESIAKYNVVQSDDMSI